MQEARQKGGSSERKHMKHSIHFLMFSITLSIHDLNKKNLLRVLFNSRCRDLSNDMNTRGEITVGVTPIYNYHLSVKHHYFGHRADLIELQTKAMQTIRTKFNLRFLIKNQFSNYFDKSKTNIYIFYTVFPNEGHRQT